MILNIRRNTKLVFVLTDSIGKRLVKIQEAGAVNLDHFPSNLLGFISRMSAVIITYFSGHASISSSV